MKRPLDVEQVPELPSDLIIGEIVRADKWRCSGPVARCSKHFLREMTRPAVLRAIMETIKRKQWWLFRWLHFLLPHELIDHSGLFVPSTAVIPVSEGGVCFLSGVYLATRLYEERECAIIDSALHRGAQSTGHAINLCQGTDHLISTEQQILLADGYYASPLSLYTRRTKEMVLSPVNTTVNQQMLRFRLSKNLTRKARLVTTHPNLWEFIDTHSSHSSEPLIGDCERCGLHALDVTSG